MSILSKSEIAKAIEDGRLTAWCHYDGEKFHRQCLPTTDSVARTLFLGKVDGVRIALTLGPLVASLTKASVPAAHRYQGYERISRLDQGGTYDLAPGESVAAFSSERLKLPLNLSGFIISRVTRDANGLTVKTSYLSNGWDGIIKLRLKNESNDIIKLQVGLDVAALFLTEVKGADEPDTKASHFGQGWHDVLTGGGNPFAETGHRERVKHPVVAFFEPLLGQVSKNPLTSVLGTVLSAGVVGAVWTLASYNARLNEFEENYSTVEKGAQQIEEIRSQLGRMPWANTATVHFPEGATEAMTSVRMAPSAGRTVVFASVAAVRPSGNAEDFLVSTMIEGGELTLRVLRRGPRTQGVAVQVNYIVAEPSD